MAYGETMRRITVALMLVVVAVTAAACGGASRAAGTGAGEVLSSIHATAPPGPQKMTADLTVDFKGTVNSVLGKVLTQPIHRRSRACSTRTPTPPRYATPRPSGTTRARCVA